MNPTDAILKFGLPIGRLSGVPVRMSFLFVVVGTAAIWRFDSIAIGALTAGVLFVSILAHEMAHLAMARSTAGDIEELDLWPLGGLSEPFGRGFWRDHVKTMMAGPLVNATVAASCLLKITNEEILPLLNPWEGLGRLNTADPASLIFGVTFVVNVYVVLANLIPITPFDAGVLVRTWLTTRFSELESRDVMVRLGLVVGSLGLVTGFVVDFNALTALSAFVIIFHFHESLRWIESPAADEFVDYDSGDDLRSLENWHSDSDEDNAFATSDDILGASHEEILERWRRQREDDRHELEQEQRRREDREVDQILEKLHLHGREALDANEVHLLKRVGDRYRNREQQHGR